MVNHVALEEGHSLVEVPVVGSRAASDIVGDPFKDESHAPSPSIASQMKPSYQQTRSMIPVGKGARRQLLLKFDIRQIFNRMPNLKLLFE